MSYRTCECGQGFGKVGDIFQIGNRKLEKKFKKIIKRIISASKVSIKNFSKSLMRKENFMKRFMINCLRVSTVKEMIRSVKIF